MCLNMHAEINAGSVASIQNVFNGCESLYVILSNKQKHDTNLNGNIVRT